jgi:hypothetical protein
MLDANALALHDMQIQNMSLVSSPTDVTVTAWFHSRAAAAVVRCSLAVAGVPA